LGTLPIEATYGREAVADMAGEDQRFASTDLMFEF
jgi:hypothetical protein